MADSIYAPQNYAEAARPNKNTSIHADDEDDAADAAPPPPAHPHLHKPLLYVSGVDPALEDKQLASGPFAAFLPVR